MEMLTHLTANFRRKQTIVLSMGILAALGHLATKALEIFISKMLLFLPEKILNILKPQRNDPANTPTIHIENSVVVIQTHVHANAWGLLRD